MVYAKSLSEAIEMIRGEGIRIENRRAVFGGDINHAYALELSDRGFREKYADRAFSWRGVKPLRRNRMVQKNK